MRGSYSTPDLPSESSTRMPEGGRFTFKWRDYDDQRSVTVDPSAFRTPVIAAELAATWLQVLTEFGRDESALTSGLQDMLRSLGDLPRAP